MEKYTFLLDNIILIVVCIILSLVFIVLPLPNNEGLKSYRITLRLFAISYFTLAVLTLLNLLSDNEEINYPIDLTTISLQTTLFSISLISLFDSYFVNKRYVLKHMFPTLLFVVSSVLVSIIWGYPTLHNMHDFVRNYTHPATILIILFLFYCIAQIIYFIVVFKSQVKKYKLKLNDYYSNTFQLQLIWVSYCFYSALTFVILVIIFIFFFTPIFGLIITAINFIFYTVFGLYYIQYPLTYIHIESMFITSSLVNREEPESNSRILSWKKLKSMIIDEKYYLRSDVNIEEMAQFLKIGRTTLSNFINKEEKMNFHTWINTLRIEEAQQIIFSNPDYSFAKVADMIGFSEPTNFSRQFKLITGHSPSVWKQKQKEISIS